jgi:cytochrome c peroxidase
VRAMLHQFRPTSRIAAIVTARPLKRVLPTAISLGHLIGFRQEFADQGNPSQAMPPGVAENTSGMTRPVARSRRMNVWISAASVMLASVGTASLWAQGMSTTLSPTALKEIAEVEAEIDRTEAAMLERLAALPDNQVQQIELLGKLMLYDKELSVNRNEACVFCHTPETGFTGPVSELNRTTGSYPGSVRTRFSNRKPQSHAYAPLSPVLHYNPGQGDLVGGNFWDMRATGRRLGNPAAEQAQGPPVNPVEMGLPDIACAVYRAAQRPYRGLFEAVWGQQAFAIQWPSEVEQVCNEPGPPPANDPTPVHLTQLDRGRASATFDQMAQSIAEYEASAEVTAFTSKFDAVQAGKAQFTPQEQAGYQLFRGKGQCNNCHRDGGPWRRSVVHRFYGKQHRHARKSRASLLRRTASGRTRLSRQSCRLILCRPGRCRFSQGRSSAQPTFIRRCALGSARAG